MRLLKWLGIWLVIVSVVFWVGWGVYNNPKTELISPVLGVSANMVSDNIWSPQESSASSDIDLPEITAEAAFFVEANTGVILYSKNPQLKKPIASLTKIMTAIIALEHKKFDDIFTVSKRASEMEPDEMILLEGEKLNLEELLSGIFLVSANDAAEVLAEQSTLNREVFIAEMNSKAKILGMNKTLFINPTGLEEDDITDPTKLRLHYSTAYDVALMSRYLISKWPKVVGISSSPHIYLPRTETHQDYELYSGINLLTTYPGVLGLKTGFTPEAGLTLVTLAKRGDSEVIGVLLGSTNRREDAQKLLDYSFKKLGH